MIEIIDIFPTQIFSGSIENFEKMNPVLIKKFYEIRDFQRSESKSNVLGWHSDSYLHENPELHFLPEFYYLKTCLINAANSIVFSMGGKTPLIYSGLWANINPKFASNIMHDHPRAILSGAYYLKNPTPVSKLKIYDPREVKSFLPNNFNPRDKKSPDTEPDNSITINPVEGNFIFFPGWLKHSVDTNFSEDDRISVSFNFIFKKENVSI
jgi:uncharacterized protein (TIGR02466 family)